MSILSDGLSALRLGNSEIDSLIAPREKEVNALLAQYVAEIELFNPAYGLVADGDIREIVTRHILDSLAPMGIIYRQVEHERGQQRKTPQEQKTPQGRENQSQGDESSDTPFAQTIQIADAGSGAGLPGIPLAIAMPDCHFTLIERMGRRAGFLWNVKAKLGLANVGVEEGELEKAAVGFFNCVTFRAFKPLEPKLLKSLFRVCAANGFLAAYKARKEKITEEMSPLEKYAHWEAIPYEVPFLNEERNLVIVKPKKKLSE